MIERLYRLATADEIAFATGVLYPLQDQVLQIAAIYGDALYLTGGTALARCYFQHRLSDDLDFFTTTGDLKRIAADFIARLVDVGFQVDISQLDLYFSRLFVVTPQATLKIDFVREPDRLGPLLPGLKGVNINSLEDIGANKITAFEDRAEVKDVIDLFYITQQMDLDTLFALADQKRVPIAYADLLTINVTGLAGYVLVTQSLDPVRLTQFVDVLADKAAEVVKKRLVVAQHHLDEVVVRLLWDFPPEDALH